MEAILIPANLPLAILAAMIAALLCTRLSMATVCSLAALAAMLAAGLAGGAGGSKTLLAHIAPEVATVFVVMSATQLAVRGILQGGAGDRISIAIAAVAAHRCLRRTPAAVLLPAIFVPAAMGLAMLLHNITAILVLTPLALNLCARYRVRPTALLAAMLIASNLGGASMAFGDTPAIIQREHWGFSAATFAAAMLPRNLVVLAILTAAACLASWLPARREATNWLDTLQRLRARDDIAAQGRYPAAHRRQATVGWLAMAAFIALQFLFPTASLLTGAAVLALLVIFTPENQRVEAYTALGLESILVIFSIFIVAGSVHQAPLVHALTDALKAHRGSGAIEICAYLLTSGISADGSAATLAPLVHELSGGSMFSAWQLACGICAGSSTLLTAASAGPILNAISRGAGQELTFRDYCKFGLPFSAVMMLVYVGFNLLAR